MMVKTIPALAAGLALALPAQDRPNIVFIMADDHASEAISCYGSWLKEHARTPNIDRIAAEGIRFDNAVNNNSLCSPSRASIMTGQYSHKNGVRGLNGTVHEASPWFSKVLREAGYQTWVVGKWHMDSAPQGYENYLVTKGQGKYFSPEFTGEDGGKVRMEGYASDVYTDIALDWLDRRDRERPFCLQLQFKAPHHPYDHHQRYNDLLRGVEVPEPETLYEAVEAGDSRLKSSYIAKSQFALFREGGSSYYSRHLEDPHPNRMDAHDPDSRESRIAAAYQHMIRKYIRCITGVDDNVGRILDYLDANNLGGNTIVVYTSDQGYWLGQHGFYDKRLILEGSVGMPLLMRYPGLIKAGSVNDDIVMNIDFGPTLLDLAGLQIPATMQGRSLRPLLAGSTPEDWRRCSYYHYYAGPSHRGIRTARYTLAMLEDGSVELFDRELDPLQRNNVAGNPERAGILAGLRRQLDELEVEVDIDGKQFPNAPIIKKNKKSKKDKTGKKSESPG